MRATSLRMFIAVAVGLTGLRLLSTVAFLAFGPGLGVEPRHVTTQVFFLLSKAFLGGLFWPVSLLIEGIVSPLGWLFYPWAF